MAEASKTPKVVRLKNAKDANNYVLSLLRKATEVVKPKVVGKVEKNK